MIVQGIIWLIGFAIVMKIYKIIFNTYRKTRYRLASKNLANQLPTVLQANEVYTWENYPGIIAVDRKQRLILIQNYFNEYQPLILIPEQILAINIERESTIHSKTKQGMTTHLFGKGWGFSFGGRSKTTSQVVNSIFLEIHFQLENAGNSWISIPFGGDHRHAESFALTLRNL